MILIPRLLNRYSKDRPSWQERYDRRLALLKFAGLRFFGPEDWALAGPLPPELQFTSVGVFPYGTVAAAAGGGGDTLTLNTLSANDSDDFIAVAGIRFKRDGEVEETINGTWTAQNSGTEWIDNNASTVGDDYEAKMDHTGGDTTPTFSGGTWAENTYNTIDEDSPSLTATVTSSSGTNNSTGTAYVREIANTSNLVSASYSISATQFGGGILL